MAGRWIKLASSHLRKAGSGHVSANPVYAVNMDFVTDVQFGGSFDGKAGSLTLGVEEPDNRPRAVYISEEDAETVRQWMDANSYKGSGAVVEA